MSLVPLPLAGMNKYKQITSRTNRKLKMSVGMYDNMYLSGPSFNRDRRTVLLDLFSFEDILRLILKFLKTKNYSVTII